MRYSYTEAQLIQWQAHHQALLNMKEVLESQIEKTEERIEQWQKKVATEGGNQD